ncbi:MAG: ATP-binding cassette domain-containing protein [Xanthomonadales bacterium]|nr:ATP-binding cassette domain-containing protein [Xanthomonadales bacterium]
MPDTVVEAHDVHRSVDTPAGSLQILSGIDLTVYSGQSVAILGESGSGKSTLLSLLAGLDLPQSGQIKINNQEITNMSEDQRSVLRATCAGFVFQSFYLMEDLNALENVALPLELFGHKAPYKTARDWLRKMGLQERVHHYPKQLSGGEQQRVALCRAFSVRPTLLFADEPTANLDHNTAQLVIKQLFDLHYESNSAMVLVTHDDKLAKRCDAMYYLRLGQLHAA